MDIDEMVLEEAISLLDTATSKLTTATVEKEIVNICDGEKETAKANALINKARRWLEALLR